LGKGKSMRQQILRASIRYTRVHHRLGSLPVMCSVLLVLLVGGAVDGTEPGPYAKEALAALEAAVDAGDAEAISDRVSEMCRYDSWDRTVPVLIRGFAHEDTEVLVAAASGLESLGRLAAPAARMVIPLLGSPEGQVRAQAEWTLASMGKRALPSLVSALKSPDVETRAGACRILEEIGVTAKAAVPALTTGLTDESWEVRYHAASALAVVASKSQAAMAALRRARAVEEDEDGRRNMDYAMGAIDPETADSTAIVEALATIALAGDFKQANVAQRALRRLGPEGRKTLAGLLATPAQQGDDEEAEDRSLYAAALAVAGPPARSELPALEAALNNASPETRVAAAVAIWSLGGRLEKPQDVLIDLVKHGEGETRRAAAMGLGTFGAQAERAVPTLLEAADDDSFAPTAGVALAMISPRVVELVPKLVKIIRRQGEDTDEAMTALLFLGRPVVPVLGSLLGSELGSDRKVAIELFTKLGPDAAPAVRALTDALDDSSGNMRDDAAEILAGLGSDAAPAIPALIDYCEAEAREGASGFRGVGAYGAVLWKLGPAGKAALAEQIAPYREAMLDELTPPIGDRAVTAALALALSQPPLDQTVPVLKEMLASEDALVRVAAARALLELGVDADMALPVLKEVLDCACKPVRAQTLRGLERHGATLRSAAPLVAAALDATDPQMRLNATRALWRIAPDHEAIVPSLRELLGSRPHSQEARGALEMIVEMKTAARPLLPTLRRVLPLDNPRATRLALQRIRPPASPAKPVPPLPKRRLGEVSPVLEEAIAEVVERVSLINVDHNKVLVDSVRGFERTHPGEPAAQQLAVALLTEACEPLRVFGAANALRRLGKPVEPVVVEALNDDEPNVRHCAVRGLVIFSEDVDRLLPQLIVRLDDPDPEVQNAAADKIFNLGEAALAAVPALKEQLESGAPHVRAQAAGTLWKVTDQAEPSCSTLIELLGHEDLEIRRSAMIYLGLMGADAAPAVPVLAAMRDEIDSYPASVYHLAHHWADALEDIGTPAAAAVPQLLEFAKDSNQRDLGRQAAIAALAEIGASDQRTVPVLLELIDREDYSIQRSAVDALGDLSAEPERVVPALVEVAEESSRLQDATIRALGRFGPDAEAAVPLIEKMLEQPEGRLRLCAAEALWRIEGDARRSLPTLIDVLSDPNTRLRSRAAEILEQIGPSAASAAGALESNLSHDYHDVRVAAARALWRITDKAEPSLDVLLSLLDKEYLPILPGGSFGSSVRCRSDVIEFLGARGPAARPALPALQKLTRHESRKLRLAAKGAIERITRAESDR
jgi:HEAT repeat protein